MLTVQPHLNQQSEGGAVDWEVVAPLLIPVLISLLCDQAWSLSKKRLAECQRPGNEHFSHVYLF